MKPRIVASVINNISFDQRVEKTNTTLYSDGYPIYLVGTTLRGTPPLKRDYTTNRLKLFFQRTGLMYAEFNLKLFIHLLFNTRKNDVLWANDLDSLLPNYIVSRLKGLPLIYDSHELFPETPAVQGRYSQKIWRFLDKRLINKPNVVITVSDSIAEWMNKNYGIKKPFVIKNLPNKRGTKKVDKENYILYQGALNIGRGLIALVESMQYIPEEYSLKIAGDGPYKQKVINKIEELGLENRIELLGLVSPKDLQAITEKAIVGVSLEEDLALSYRYSLPNKLFDYIQAQTPIVGTYLPEIKNIIETYSIGEIIESHAPKDIAKSINEVLEKPLNFYEDGLEKASSELTWEKQEEVLLTLISSLNKS